MTLLQEMYGVPLAVELLAQAQDTVGDALDVFARYAPSCPTNDALREHLQSWARAPIATFDAETRSLPLRTADAGIRAVLTRRAEELLSKDDDVEMRELRRVVTELLHDGGPTLVVVARRLGVAKRTLQRRLFIRGLSYRAFLDDVRERAAKASLARGSATPSELAGLLGFSHPAGFARAFRRWTGTTPTDYRDTIRG